MNRTLLTIPAWLVVVGCFDKGRQDLANGPHCEDSPAVVTLEEITELGFTGADMLALAQGEHLETLSWAADGSTSPVLVTVTYSEGEVRFVDSEAVYPDTGMTIGIGIECSDRVELDATIAISTEDGALAESYELTLASGDGTSVSARSSFDHEAMQGSYTFSLMDPSEYDSVTHSLSFLFDEAGSSGEFSAQAEGCDDDCDGDECTCWASMDTIATWPAEDLE
jgi:hypothetical protein